VFATGEVLVIPTRLPAIGAAPRMATAEKAIRMPCARAMCACHAVARLAEHPVHGRSGDLRARIARTIRRPIESPAARPDRPAAQAALRFDVRRS
jgi:hypothetical protein